MISDSIISRGAIYAIAVIQSIIAPIAFFYYIYYIIAEQKFVGLHPSLDTFIHYWLGCELMFYVYFQIARNRMQRLLPNVSPNPQERSDLYTLCLANIDDAELWLPGWFATLDHPNQHPKFEDIYRENLAEWYNHNKL
jgi:hypothetical protein